MVEKNRSFVNFAEFGDGVSASWCDKAEEAIGRRLPPSLRWWLQGFGGGEVLGEEIYSIYEVDFDAVVGGDLVAQYRSRLASGEIGRFNLPICCSDVDGLFVLDLQRVNLEGESPVVAYSLGFDYAEDFSEFLAKRIELGLVGE